MSFQFIVKQLLHSASNSCPYIISLSLSLPLTLARDGVPGAHVSRIAKCSVTEATALASWRTKQIDLRNDHIDIHNAHGKGIYRCDF